MPEEFTKFTSFFLRGMEPAPNLRFLLNLCRARSIAFILEVISSLFFGMSPCAHSISQVASFMRSSLVSI